MKQKKLNEKQNRVVLAYGEVTGHAHAFYDTTAVEYDGNKLKVKSSAALQHEEHTTHTFEPGIGEVTIQQEYQMKELKRVAD